MSVTVTVNIIVTVWLAPTLLPSSLVAAAESRKFYIIASVCAGYPGILANK